MVRGPKQVQELLANIAEHKALIKVNVNGWDDIPTLQCEREECMVDYQDLRDGPTRKVWWTTDIYNFTPEQVVEARDKHLKETHG